MEETDIPPAWQAAAARILKKRWRKILVIGATDRGKSTYCRFLIRYLCAAGHKTAFVDADVGQKDGGPPATITLTYGETEPAPCQQGLAGIYFVGAVTPVGHFLPMVVGTRRMVDMARASFVVINTTGLIQDSGQILKAFQIASLQPTAIVALEKNWELNPLVRAHRHHNIIRLPVSSRAAAKSREVRRAFREHAFCTYFQEARETVLDLKRLSVQRCLLFHGKPLQDQRFLYAERTAEGIVAVSKTSSHVDLPGLQVLPAGFEKHLLCGLADRHDRGLGLAVMRAIDYRKATLTLLTPVPVRQIKVLQFSELYLDFL